jgi:hypothetical protein
MVAFIETPFENVMEGGVRLPAPGEEAEWEAQFGRLIGGFVHVASGVEEA